MRLLSVKLQDYRSYADSGEINFDQINLLVGRNNSGKSAIIRAIAQLQSGILPIVENDIRKGFHQAIVSASLEMQHGDYDKHFDVSPETVAKRVRLDYRHARANKPSYILSEFQESRQPLRDRSGVIINRPIKNVEPYNFIYPYLAKRKVTDFDRTINISKVNAIDSNLVNLTSKIQRLANEGHPKAEEYARYCKKVLGFKISTHAAPNGQQSGIHVGKFDYLPIEDMGEGVANLVGLITMLCLAENNLFLIEEIENDVHPEALKALLDIIVEKSNDNQFILSTHSNIVVKWLGSAPQSRVYSVNMEMNPPQTLPTSSIILVEPSAESRIKILEDLGYELGDFNLWAGWIFLEESSAEQIIREYLIKLFAPQLTKCRTLSTNGTGKLASRFDDFNRLFLFTHLESLYINKAWVIADADGHNDTSGSDAIEKIKQIYCQRPGSKWEESNFFTWSKHDFEEYYPERFKSEVTRVLTITNKDIKREEKKKLLMEKVIPWCRGENETSLRAEFMKSASEVIDKLQTIESKLFSRTPPHR